MLVVIPWSLKNNVQKNNSVLCSVQIQFFFLWEMCLIHGELNGWWFTHRCRGLAVYLDKREK